MEIIVFVFIIFLLVSVFILWGYSRYFIRYSHELTSLHYNLYPDHNEVIFDMSLRKDKPVFLRVVFEDKSSRMDREGHVLINEYDPFSQLFWYDFDRYYFVKPEDGTPFSVEYDRPQKRALIRYDDIEFVISANGKILECNDARILIDKSKFTEIRLRNTELSISVHSDCSTVVLIPQNAEPNDETDEN